jgi:hypothetical protein
MFTIWPDYDSPMLMYEDNYFVNNTWIWDDKPHWAYDTEYMVLEKNRKAIEWTPNTISSDVAITDKKAVITLTSSTPNLKEYQMKSNDSDIWNKVEDNLEIQLENDKQEVLFRAVNLVNIAGPEHKVLIVCE